MSKIIGIVATNTTAYVEAVFANFAKKNIVVPLTHSDDQYRIKAAGIEQVLEPDDNQTQWMKPPFTPINSDEIALIAFTSGTEGHPKGVKITHNNLAEVVQRLNTLMQVDSSISEYIGVPVYHSFGLGRCRAVASVGGRFFIPAQGFNPFEIAEMLKNEQINAISAVPSLWRILLEEKAVIGDYGKQVKWIEIGSQYMSQEEKETLKKLFPHANIVQHYGLTEASRTTLLEIHKTTGEELESVGKTFGDIQVKIIENGQIAIAGPHVATEYIIDQQSVPLKDETGWFITNDLGEIKDGYLYYRGRADDVINCGGIKVSPEQLETKIFPLIEDTTQIAICRKPDPLRGDGFLVAVTAEFKMNKPELHHLILEAAQQFGVNAANAISIVEVDELPRTSSGKIQRQKLSQQYGQVEGIKFEAVETSAQHHYVAPTTPEEKMLCEVAQNILKIDKVSVTDDFLVLGVDSLLSIKITFQLKSKGLTDDLIKDILSGSTIQEIAARLSSNEKPLPQKAEKQEKQTKRQAVLNTTEAINAVRGIAILAIIFNHWIEGFLNKILTPAFAHQIAEIIRFPGTPTFALAFGLFLSYLYADYFQKANFANKLRFLNNRIFILLLAIFLVGLPAYTRMIIAGDFSATTFVKATYSVLNYYLLAMLTLPLLLHFLLKTKHYIAITVILAIISMSIAVYQQNFIQWPLWQTGWLLWVKLNSVAYYGYFNLLAFSLLGVAIGLFLKGFNYEKSKIYTLLAIGSTLVLIGIVLDGHNHLVEKFRFLFPQLIFHTGIALLITLSMLMISQLKGNTGYIFLTMRSLLSTIGIMTLPLYILHGYVIPLKNTLIYFNFSTLIAFIIPLTLFLITIGWLAKTIHRTKATI